MGSRGCCAWTISRLAVPGGTRRTAPRAIRWICVDLRLGVEGDSWSVTAWSKNLTDEKYNAEFSPGGFLFRALPRRATASTSSSASDGARRSATRGHDLWLSRLNLPSRLHHTAYVSKNLEATRRFYEDLIGLPLVATWCESDLLFGEERTYCHCFFGMADGGALAFFQFAIRTISRNSGRRCRTRRSTTSR